jgi:hypothetical protein
VTDLITKLPWKYNIGKLNAHLIAMMQWEECEWSYNNSISFTYDPNTEADLPWQKAIHGGAIERSRQNNVISRKDEWYSVFIDRFALTEFAEVWKDMNSRIDGGIFRMRLVRMMPRTCLSIHVDFSVRYIIPIVTNKNCLTLIDQGDTNFVSNDIKIDNVGSYHLPADGGVYRFDACNHHTGFNGGSTPKIQLVISAHD